jgi:hypothetical protein
MTCIFGAIRTITNNNFALKVNSLIGVHLLSSINDSRHRLEDRTSFKLISMCNYSLLYESKISKIIANIVTVNLFTELSSGRAWYFTPTLIECANSQYYSLKIHYR